MRRAHEALDAAIGEDSVGLTVALAWLDDADLHRVQLAALALATAAASMRETRNIPMTGAREDPS